LSTFLGRNFDRRLTPPTNAYQNPLLVFGAPKIAKFPRVPEQLPTRSTNLARGLHIESLLVSPKKGGFESRLAKVSYQINKYGQRAPHRIPPSCRKSGTAKK